MDLFCIADEETVRGFGLAGISGQAVSTMEEAAGALANKAAQPRAGIIVLTEAVATQISEQVEAIRQGHDRPLIVEIPGPEGPLAGRISLRQIAQAAAGIRVGA